MSDPPRRPADIVIRWIVLIAGSTTLAVLIEKSFGTNGTMILAPLLLVGGYCIAKGDAA